MREMFSLLVAIVLGALSAHFLDIETNLASDANMLFLYALLFIVGMELAKSKINLKQMSLSDLVLPLLTILGSFIGAILAAAAMDSLEVYDSLAVVSGFSFSSFAGAMLSEVKNPTIGLIALISNLFRECLTICFAPYIIKFFGERSYIASAGSTSIDTCLPSLVKYSSGKTVGLSMFSGAILTLMVPVFISFFAGA